MRSGGRLLSSRPSAGVPGGVGSPAPTPSGTIELDNVSLLYPSPRGGESVHVLERVAFTVPSGQVVCIVGPSGCGKTSVLNLVAGLVAPSAGSIKVGGIHVTGPGRDRGVVFQQYALFPWLSALENVEFSLRMRGIEKRLRRGMALEYLELVDMTRAADVLPKALSGGMKQRVALARAYAADPQVLLMDEPFGALDAQTRRRLQLDLLRTLERDRRTVVFVTHDVEEAVLLGERVIVMKPAPGEVLADLPISLEKDGRGECTGTDAFRHTVLKVARTLAQEGEGPGFRR